MAKDTIEKFSKLIYTKFGINIQPHKYFILEHKLRRLTQKEKFKDLDEFYELVKNDDPYCVECLVRHVTTNHTFFFREKSHFTILSDDINKKHTKSPVIWVAGSSTGEEVYTIVIQLLENHITDFLIMATDIDKEVLFKMKKGIYTAERLKEVSSHSLKKYFRYNQKDNTYKVKEILKKNIRIKCLNFVENIKFEAQFDYVFCRNVLIYFDQETQRKVITTLLNNLKKEGFLFLGHSENLLTMQDLTTSVMNSVYKKKHSYVKS